MLITPKRKAKFYKAFRITKLPYYPSILGIETGNFCNLKCPLCPTGSGQEGLEKGFMKLEMFSKIFCELSGSLKSLNLYSWGEPLLNNDLIKIIKYAKKVKPSVRITTSTNLNIRDDALLGELVASGIDEIIVSCDGASQESYSKYRVGGDFDLVLKNLKFLAEKKNELRKNVLIVWNFLVFKHNEHEVDKAQHLAEVLGVNFRIGLMRTSMKDEILQDHAKTIEKDLDWIPDNPKYSAYDKVKKAPKKSIKTCRKPWQETSVNWDGKVFPCCAIFGEKFAFGNIGVKNFKEIWNSNLYEKARLEILARTKTRDTICGICKSHGFTHM